MKRGRRKDLLNIRAKGTWRWRESGMQKSRRLCSNGANGWVPWLPWQWDTQAVSQASAVLTLGVQPDTCWKAQTLTQQKGSRGRCVSHGAGPFAESDSLAAPTGGLQDTRLLTGHRTQKVLWLSQGTVGRGGADGDALASCWLLFPPITRLLEQRDPVGRGR